MTWIRIRWKYYKIDKGFNKAGRPKVFGMIAEEIDRIYAASEEQESEVKPEKRYASHGQFSGDRPLVPKDSEQPNQERV